MWFFRCLIKIFEHGMQCACVIRCIMRTPGGHNYNLIGNEFIWIIFWVLFIFSVCDISFINFASNNLIKCNERILITHTGLFCPVKFFLFVSHCNNKTEWMNIAYRHIFLWHNRKILWKFCFSLYRTIWKTSIIGYDFIKEPLVDNVRQVTHAFLLQYKLTVLGRYQWDEHRTPVKYQANKWFILLQNCNGINTLTRPVNICNLCYEKIIYHKILFFFSYFFICLPQMVPRLALPILTINCNQPKSKYFSLKTGDWVKLWADSYSTKSSLLS